MQRAGGMNASASDTYNAMRALYGRSSAEIVADLRGVARIVARELDGWIDAAPNAAALVTLETSIEGLKNLTRQLRLAQQSLGTT